MKTLAVIVRSVRERTEEACIEIVRSQLGSKDPLHVVRDKPFPQAHIESMRLAVEAGTKWALLLDADVLLRQDAIAQMITEAEGITIPFYMLNFRVLDKGFDGPAYGVHLYSVKHLQIALQFSQVAYESQRPELQLCKEMATKVGIPSLSSTKIVGLHGYEQFYTDLYRTTFVRAVKFARYTDYFLWLYRSRYVSNDFDYRVMLWGLIDGMVYRANHSLAPLEKKQYQDKALSVLSLLGLSEKEDFLDSWYPVDHIIDSHTPNERYYEIAKRICPSDRFAVKVPDRSLHKRMRQLFSAVERRVKKVIKVAIYG